MTQDITITKPHSGDFQGHFDGNGYTITLSGMTSSPFGIVNGPSTIENLKVAGSVTGTSYLAGIAGMANTADGEIKIINCMNTADITGTSPVGGIVGGCTSSANTLTIQGCANLGDITGSNNKVGGIIGVAQYAAHKIVDCYNQGKVTGFNNYAGIVGHNGGKTQGNASPVVVQNCYSTGAIEKYGTSTNDGYAIVGGGTGANTTNSYALTGVAEALCKVDGTNCAFKTDAEMKSADFAALLGDGFMAKAGSYPTLAWEVPTASKTFHITPGGGDAHRPEGQRDGLFRHGRGADGLSPCGHVYLHGLLRGLRDKERRCVHSFRGGGGRRRDAFGGYRLFGRGRYRVGQPHGHEEPRVRDCNDQGRSW